MKHFHFRLGMRTTKTGIAVLLCILIYHFFDRQYTMIAALSAVFALREDISATFTFGKARILGNTLGAVGAIIFALISQYFHYNFWIELFLIPLLVIGIIVLFDGLDYNAGIIGSVATLLIIIYTIPHGQSVLYAFQRLLDTVIGVAVAIIVNRVIKTPKPKKEQEINSKETELEEELTSLEKQKEALKKSSSD